SGDEVQTVQVYVTLSEETIAYAEELLATYYQEYGNASQEVLAELAAIEEDLAAIAENTAAMAQSLAEMEQALNAGLALAEESIAQLEAAAQSAYATLEQAQAQADALRAAIQAASTDAGSAPPASVQDFSAILAGVQAQEIVQDPAAAVRQAQNYAQIAAAALADGALDAQEMQAIAQVGANVVASMEQQAAPPYQALARQVETVNQALARGDMAAAQQELARMENQLHNVLIPSSNRPTTSQPVPGQPGGNRGSRRP
ncbi:MAG: hypothetical protein D6790_19740, partial [Caldilineae bacterium]